MEMTTAKTVAVFAIIFGCFGVLYPKIFHPMVLHVLGLSQPKPKNNDDLQPGMPHRMKPGGVSSVKSNSKRDELPGHLRGGPHPGMRAAAEMKKQVAAQQGSSGRGMMGVVLPMYAVGIVIYLVYTMTKVFGRKEKAAKSSSEGRGDSMGSRFSDVRYNPDRQKFVVDDDVEEMKRRKIFNQQKDLEKLLLKADKEDINDVEMTELKRRLLETEAQMARILEAMDVVQQKVGSSVSAVGSEALQGDFGDLTIDNSTKVAQDDEEDDDDEELELDDEADDVGLMMDYAADLDDAEEDEDVEDEDAEDEEAPTDDIRQSSEESKNSSRNFASLADELRAEPSAYEKNDSNSTDHERNRDSLRNLRKRIQQPSSSDRGD